MSHFYTPWKRDTGLRWVKTDSCLQQRHQYCLSILPVNSSKKIHLLGFKQHWGSWRSKKIRVFRNEYFITKHIIITRHDLFEIRYISNLTNLQRKIWNYNISRDDSSPDMQFNSSARYPSIQCNRTDIWRSVFQIKL